MTITTVLSRFWDEGILIPSFHTSSTVWDAPNNSAPEKKKVLITAGFSQMASASSGVHKLTTLLKRLPVSNIRIVSYSVQITKSTPGFEDCHLICTCHQQGGTTDNSMRMANPKTCFCVRKGRVCWTVQKKAMMNEDQIMFQVIRQGRADRKTQGTCNHRENLTMAFFQCEEPPTDCSELQSPPVSLCPQLP